MALRDQLAEVFVKVTADIDKAMKDLEKANKASRDSVDRDKKTLRAQMLAKGVLEKLEGKVTATTKKRILEKIKLDKLMTDKQIEELAKRIVKEEAAAKKSTRLLKDKKAQFDMVQSHIEQKLASFRDYSGRIDEESLKKFNAVQRQKAAAYESFLQRASSEHSRYATRLDQRDMTTSVIENMRRGFEKGVLVSKKWHADENTIQRIGRGIGIAASSLRRVKDDSEMALAAFQRLQRVGYSLQAIIGALAGTIGSLVGGIFALVGVAGQAAYASAALGSAMVSMGAGMISARIALGGVGEAVTQMLDPQRKLQGALRNTRRELRNLRFEAEDAALSQEEAAINLEKAREELARVQDLPPDSRVRRETELQFQQAELAYRRAKARNEDARKDLKKGPVGGALPDPMAKLTKSQKDFAKYLVTLKPLMDQLKEAAASGFLPILQTAIQTVVEKAFPVLESGLNILGTAMGNASKSFANAFTTPQNLLLLQNFFVSSKPIIETFGRAAGNALGGVLGLLNAARPLTERFSKWIESSSNRFENWGKGSGLERFLNLSGDVAASLGRVFKSVFGGLKNILDATFPGGDIEAGAGGILLQWLQRLTDGFKAFTGSTQFASWLENSTRNATTALSSIGALLKPLLDLAAMPEIGEFWTILRGAAEPIKKLLEDGAKAAPEFAAMLVSVIKLFAAFSDSGALEAFFNTLKAISDIIVAVFANPVVKMFLDVIGRIHGVFLAIGLAIIAFKGVFMVFGGIIKTVFINIGKVAGVFTKINVFGLTAVLRFQKLRAESKNWGEAVRKVKDDFAATMRSASATRKSAFLVQMAKDAGIADSKVRKLKDSLDKVITQQRDIASGGGKANFGTKFLMAQAIKEAGVSEKTGKPLTAKYSLENESQLLTGIAGGPDEKTRLRDRFSRGRILTGFAGGRAASGLLGGAAMAGSMMSTTGGSALTTALGGISMATSLIPGPIGLLASAATGIGSAISAGFDAAAQAEKERKYTINARSMEIAAKQAAITVEKETKAQGEIAGYMALGKSFKQATDIQQREQAQSVALASKYNISQDTAQGFREALISEGYGKSIAADSKESNKMMEALAALSKNLPNLSPADLVPILQKSMESRGAKGLDEIINQSGLVTYGGKQLTSREASDASRAAGASAIAAEDQRKNIGMLQSVVDLIKSRSGYTTAGTPSLNDPDIKNMLNTANFKMPDIKGDANKLSGAGLIAEITRQINVEKDKQGATTGPTGKIGDEINVSDPELKKLGPALSKLANATPNVMVVNVKNKSELDALYKKLGLPAT